VLASLTAVAILFMIGGFAMLRQHHSHPAGSNYVPPHVKDGKVIPGQFK